MKKGLQLLSLCLPLFLIHLTGQAQFKRGTIFVGTTVGTVGYSGTTSDYSYDLGGSRSTTTQAYTFSVGPQVGFFLTPRLVAGSSFTLNFSDSRAHTNNVSATQQLTGSTSNTTTFTVGLVPFARYYFSNLNSRNVFYGQLSSSLASGTGNSSGTASNIGSSSVSSGKVDNIFNWNAAGSLGMSHILYRRIAMDFALGYTYTHQKSYNTNSTVNTKASNGAITTTTNNYTLQSGINGLSASVGFHFFLN